MSNEQRYDPAQVRLGFWGTLRVLLPYFKDKLMEQIKSIWFIIAYLCFFQLVILKLPLVYSVMIGLGLFIVAVGLMFFMEGLRLGLMPLGETIGAILPRNAKLPYILLFAFILGIGATMAEPAIAVLQAAGSGVKPSQAPLLYSLLNDFSNQLVLSVAIGVGCAVLLGVLRFFYGWSLKKLIIPLITLLTALTLYAVSNEVLFPIVGLAWDCGAVTTGPVTVPLVIALGIGVCRIVGGEDSSNAGFGIVTLASLFPIIAVLFLGIFHLQQEDYYGAANDPIEREIVVEEIPALPMKEQATANRKFTEEEFAAYLETGETPESYRVVYEGGEKVLQDGRIVHQGVDIVFEKVKDPARYEGDVLMWNPQSEIIRETGLALIAAMRAIIPLCALLFIVLLVFLKEKIKHWDEMSVGIVFSILGMFLFGLGISTGLTPLGSQLGSNIPSTFATIAPWGLEGSYGPLFEFSSLGKWLAILFAFFLGYGATLAEPALNALGVTVEKITIGAFKKNLLMQSVAIGVGIGIATGVFKIAYNVPLPFLLLPPYLFLIFLTTISTEEFVNFGWDSAGVTTGPITVPLVLAMGLGIGANVPGVTDGFGILALASAGPIITVLTVGLIVRKTSNPNEESY